MITIKILFLVHSKIGVIKPSGVIANKESWVSLKCFSLTEPLWFKDSIPLSRQLYRNPYVLTIRNFTSNNAGNYQCKGTKENGQNFTAKAEVLNTGLLRES